MRRARETGVTKLRRLYDDNLYDFSAPQPSYWEATAEPPAFSSPPLNRDDSCDVAIIGGGYTGLSAAYHLAKDYQLDARVLEAGHIGWGASGRNGGFCCIGGTGLRPRGMIRRFGLEAARAWYRSQVQAVELVRHLARDEAIDIEAFGAAEVEIAHSLRAFASMEAEHRAMTGLLGLDAELLTRYEVSERIYQSADQHGALITRPALGLHPLRFCRGLALAASCRGAKLHSSSEVLDWSRSAGGTHRLSTAGGTLRAGKVLFATNGFMPEQLRAEFFGRTLPVISAIVVTRPLTDDERLNAGWHTEHPAINSRHLLNYFRLLPDNRFLFGARGHTRGTREGEKATYRKIIGTFRRHWPGWADAEIEYRWHGLICMTAALRPGIGRMVYDAHTFFGFGYHGNGVNTATWAGKQLADWIARGKAPDDLPGFARELPRRYPLPALRRAYLRTGLVVANWLDGL
jgi:glycine/D-amino acid oxidase-like deaminating enzyme